MKSRSLVGMNDFRVSESTNMIEHNRRCLYSRRQLGGEQLNLSGEGINDNKYILSTMCIFASGSRLTSSSIVYNQSPIIYQLSYLKCSITIIYLSSIFHQSIINLSSFYHLSTHTSRVNTNIIHYY